MVERIRTLLETRQLTPTQFADLIGVARPIVSHVLSGRNKPSLEVVQRILAAMPELAMPWLLNGSGPMLAPAAISGAEAVQRSTVAPVPGPVSSPGSVPTPTPVEPVLPVPAPVSPEASALATLPTPGVARPSEVVYSRKTTDSQYDVLNARSAATQATPVSSSAGKYLGNTVESTGRAGKPLPFKASQNKPAARPRRFVVAAPTSSTGSGVDEQGASPQTEPVVPPAVAAPAPTIAIPELAVAPEPAAPQSPVQPSVAADSGPVAVGVASGSAMAQALFAGAEKPIRRIVIFYRDGSFADYQPE